LFTLLPTKLYYQETLIISTLKMSIAFARIVYTPVLELKTPAGPYPRVGGIYNLILPPAPISGNPLFQPSIN
jgi:hypothetical protein